MNSGAIISECGTYRYRLWRVFDPLPGKGTVVFIMLNPSTADAKQDDPTIRRCIGFARDWGYSRLEVVNLHPLRATDPADLNRRHEDWQMPSDVKNEKVIEEVFCEADLVVAAWGALKWAWLDARAERVMHLADDELVQLHVLGLTKHGFPRHPLYMRRDVKPERWDP